jgi:hypothetical protein
MAHSILIHCYGMRCQVQNFNHEDRGGRFHQNNGKTRQHSVTSRKTDISKYIRLQRSHSSQQNGHTALILPKLRPIFCSMVPCILKSVGSYFCTFCTVNISILT